MEQQSVGQDCGDIQTKDRLIQAALRLFARHGIEAVSLRQITAQAEQSNQSAIQYYFRNKRGLVAAVLEFVLHELNPIHEQALAELKALSTRRRPEVRDVISAYLNPFVAWYAGSDTGRRSVRFLSRLTWQADVAEFDQLISQCLPYFDPAITYLHAALPNMSRQVVATKFLFAMTTVVHGMADTRLLAGVALPTVGPLYQTRPMDFLGHFRDYIVGGICYESSTGDATKQG